MVRFLIAKKVHSPGSNQQVIYKCLNKPSTWTWCADVQVCQKMRGGEHFSTGLGCPGEECLIQTNSDE